MTTGVGSDPVALVGRVFEQLVQQLAPDDVLAGRGGMPADELLAKALGDRLARMIASDDDGAQPDGSEIDGGRERLAHYHELLDRNSALAAALGACDCWGQHRGCPVCDGAGTPGWTLPDEELFATYVQPAVSTDTSRRTQKTPSTTDINERREPDECPPTGLNQ
jgi:hypothetical protein